MRVWTWHLIRVVVVALVFEVAYTFTALHFLGQVLGTSCVVAIAVTSLRWPVLTRVGRRGWLALGVGWLVGFTASLALFAAGVDLRGPHTSGAAGVVGVAGSLALVAGALGFAAHGVRVRRREARDIEQMRRELEEQLSHLPKIDPQ